ncbi:metal-sulfur cluster assembly factor [Falsochrobactrum sp. TDYN1]|uniref:Metal-sulfur cluster assembly factor n=1 Tax=Falsochrobactrum tianjinense TaxID=2706015 RepID=A0A949PNN9_9HYPH|nr:metal-sulfur cluster assembly factor [Falsochrobactrum sp. TDYN1]MBV2143665.1 metal-sulfur cluster assembly factor [Falsochrobactrum sp. TDYN1]
MRSDEREDLIHAIRKALRIVLDPELGVNLVDLGMIYTVAVRENGAADIKMTTTTRGCPAAGFLTQAVRACAESVAGVRQANVELTYEPEWKPEMATVEVQALFAI